MRTISVSPSKQNPRSPLASSSVDPNLDDSVDSTLSDSSKSVIAEEDTLKGNPPKDHTWADGDMGQEQRMKSLTKTIQSPPHKVAPSSSNRTCDRDSERKSDTDSDRSTETECLDNAVNVDRVPKKESKSRSKKKVKEILQLDSIDSKSKIDQNETKKKIHVEIVVTQFNSPADFSVQIANSGSEELHKYDIMYILILNTSRHIFEFSKTNYIVVVLVVCVCVCMLATKNLTLYHF